MKIALFIPTLDGGGAQRVALNLAEGFINRGYEVDLLLVKKEGVLLNSIPEGVNLVSFNKTRTLFSIPNLFKVFWGKKYKSIISFMNYVNICAAISFLFAFKRTPLIVTEHQTYSKNKSKWEVNSILTKFLYERVTHIVAVSKGAANDLKTFLNLKKDVHVIYNPIVGQKLIAHNMKRSFLPPDQWFKEDIPVIVSAGRLVSLKGFNTLLRAIKLVNNEVTCRLIILGEGEDREKLKRLLFELDIELKVKLPGFVDNVYEYMSCADLFVLSSKSEGFGNVLVEAMACGTTVVSTDCPNGPAEILEGGKWGTLVTVDDVYEMKNAIMKNLNSKKRDVSKRVNNFHVDTISKKYIALIK